MKTDEASRQDYYQQIVRHFLKHQTAMFFLPTPRSGFDFGLGKAGYSPGANS